MPAPNGGERMGGGEDMNIERWMYAESRPNRIARTLNRGWAAM